MRNNNSTAARCRSWTPPRRYCLKLRAHHAAVSATREQKRLKIEVPINVKLKVGDGPKGGISWRCSRAAILCREKDMPHDEDYNTQLPDPSGFSPDPLTDILRSGARRLIERAVEAELTALLAAYADERTGDGRARLVRHGHLPEREVMHHCPAGDLAKPNLPRGGHRPRACEGSAGAGSGRR